MKNLNLLYQYCQKLLSNKHAFVKVRIYKNIQIRSYKSDTQKVVKILIMNFNILDVGTYWFNNKNTWFDADKHDDEEITNKFLPYLQLKENSSLSVKEKLCYIILYDQMVRHFLRSNPNLIPEAKEYYLKALNLSMHLLNNNLDKNLTPEEKCFLLLPLRHTFNLSYLEIVINKIKEYTKDEDFRNSSIYRRFWRATLISYSAIQTPLIEPEKINENISNEQIFEILDKEHHSASNLSSVLPLSRKNKFYRAFESLFTSTIKNKKVIISLSGGVDSMVASFVMSHCCKELGIEVIGVHINYGNRNTCVFEVELVKRWAKLLNIKLYIRHIEHLKRLGKEEEGSGLTSDDRTLYEEVTRIIRFQMYAKFPNTFVVLGHNLDDCEENMLTNIRKNKCYDNLLGMKKVGNNRCDIGLQTKSDNYENQIILLRPMLDIPKKEIYDFAYEYEIPHLYDSTPKWSDRGKMRNELIPFLNRFDPAFLPGLFNLSSTLTNLYKIYSSSVLSEFRKNKIDILHNKILVDNDSPELDYGYQFWKDIIYGILYSFNTENKDLIPSNKSIAFLSEKLSHRHYGKISLNNYLIFDFNKDRIIYSITK